jgi:tetratricopeptide (TPR) repeat protein
MRYFSVLFICLFILISTVQAQELTSASEYSQRAITRFEKNDLEGAIADFTKVIELNGPNLEFCYYFRGLAHYRKGNLDQAIDDLSKAISIKGDARFYDDRANLLAKHGDLDRAIADLDMAIKVAPQFAKAYGDRGLLRLMKGQEAEAEVDFKKCFELDKSLESQFRAAASKIKQRSVSAYGKEKPADVEITNFSWTEASSKVLIASPSPAIAVTSTAVSATGTRVMADPGAKGLPGPPEVANSSEGMSAAGGSTSTRDVIEYKFSASIKNTGGKTIVAVKWAYLFEPRDLNREGLAYLFLTKTTIKAGHEKTLTDSIVPNTKNPMKMPHKNNEALFNERVAILRLDFGDGSSWENSGNEGMRSVPR